MGKWRPIWTCEPVPADLGTVAPPGVMPQSEMDDWYSRRKTPNEVADGQEM